VPLDIPSSSTKEVECYGADGKRWIMVDVIVDVIVDAGHVSLRDSRTVYNFKRRYHFSPFLSLALDPRL